MVDISADSIWSQEQELKYPFSKWPIYHVPVDFPESSQVKKSVVKAGIVLSQPFLDQPEYFSWMKPE